MTDIEMGRYIGACLRILAFIAAVVFVPIYFILENLSIWLGLDKKWVLWAVGLALFMVMVQLRLGQWQVRKKAKSYGVIQAPKSLLDMGLLLFCDLTVIRRRWPCICANHDRWAVRALSPLVVKTRQAA
ncbi:MAG: hypothetical protein V7693_17715 [Halopseudomonas sabulinigri]